MGTTAPIFTEFASLGRILKKVAQDTPLRISHHKYKHNRSFYIFKLLHEIILPNIIKSKYYSHYHNNFLAGTDLNITRADSTQIKVEYILEYLKLQIYHKT